MCAISSDRPKRASSVTGRIPRPAAARAWAKGEEPVSDMAAKARPARPTASSTTSRAALERVMRISGPVTGSAREIVERRLQG
ncbi:hypothetical protein GCM10010433_51600 [Streptomyces pulveraceus]